MRHNSSGLRILVCLLILSTFFVFSCREETPEPDRLDVNQTQPQTIEQLPPEDEDIAVTVNGFDIKESQVQAIIKPELERLLASNAQLPPAMLEQYAKQLRQQVLEQFIVTHLLDEKVQEANIVVTDEQVISEITEVLLEQEPPLSLEDYKIRLGEYGVSFEEEKQRVRNGLGYQKILETYWAGKINVTEEDANDFYNENRDQFVIPEQVRASHILISVEQTDPNEIKESSKSKIQELLEQIRDGADFAELAKANSDCPSSAQGGDLGFFSRGMMVEPFEKVAFELQAGQISDIVETEFGYHIIKVTERRDAGVTSFQQARDDIIEHLKQQKQDEYAQEYIESLKAQATIEYPTTEETQQEPVERISR